jgi:hypothetical protein
MKKGGQLTTLVLIKVEAMQIELILEEQKKKISYWYKWKKWY